MCENAIGPLLFFGLQRRARATGKKRTRGSFIQRANVEMHPMLFKCYNVKTLAGRVARHPTPCIVIPFPNDCSQRPREEN
mmetsp:Transcript_35827/g.66279  ORF Transcript_35827/g.66279 Transcript_35827/m.66279 type:complete len:80 (-) Transcript_35827:567-806(-)